MKNKSKSFFMQQWILHLQSEFLLSHPMFSIFWWALVKQAHFLIANDACVWWDVKIKLGLFHWSPATKIKKPNFALHNFNSFECMAGIKSRSSSSKCNLVNSSSGDPRYRIFSKSFSHRMPLEDYKWMLFKTYFSYDMKQMEPQVSSSELYKKKFCSF